MCKLLRKLISVCRCLAANMVVTCTWCGAVLDGELSLLAHILSSHAPKASTSNDASVDNVPKRDTTKDIPTDKTMHGAVTDHVCSVCEKKFSHKRSLTRHVREVHQEKSDVKCPKCSKPVKNRRSLLRHIKNMHGPEKKQSKCDRLRLNRSRRNEVVKRRFKCRQCKETFSTLKKLYRHRRSAHPSRLDTYVCNACWRRYLTPSAYMLHINMCTERRLKKEKFQRLRKSLYRTEEAQWETKTAINGDARIHLLNVTHENDLQMTLLMNKTPVQTILQTDMTELKRVKWYMVAHVRVKSDEVDGDKDNTVRYLRCPNFSLLRVEELEEQIREAITHVLHNFDAHQEEGSKILFERVEKIELKVAKLALLKGSSFLPLPDWLKKPSKGLINIQNYHDNKCFLYSVLAGLKLPKRNSYRVSSYKPREREINMKGIKFPVKVKDISKVEENNPQLSVSVFALEEDTTIVPLRVSRQQTRAKHVNLLYITDPDSDESHYVLIKNMSSFLGHLTKRKKHLFWCDNCLTPRPNLQKHLAHRTNCIQYDAQAIQMPVPTQSVMKFTDYDKQLHHDYVIYCDLECILEPYSTALPDPSVSSTTRTSRHVPSGFCYVVVGPEGKLIKPPVLEHGGDNVVRRMLRCLKHEEAAIKKLRGEPFPIDMTTASEKAFEDASVCYLCKDPLPRRGVAKVRDHDHTKEKDNFRGAACHGCNLNLKMRNFIPTFFHNLTGYDAHLIMSEIGYLSDGSDLTAIPKTKEKYISFSWGKLRFLDSYNFLSSSLEKLVRDLKPEEMEILKSMYPDDEKRSLLSRKGVYPYCYFESFENFEEEKLPPKECFKSDLSNNDISDADYAHAQNVFAKFNMDNLWDYHDLYLLTDVLLLADVMETYRKVTMKHFKLDVVHYYTTPGFSWSAALLYTGQKLELIESLDDHLMWEKGMRGGVATINCRSVYANNPLVPDIYDATKDNSYIMYLDANNLYGAAMSRSLPVGSFRLLSDAEIQEVDILKIDQSDEDGFLFEVDLEYPKKLHDLHNDFCLAPEHYAPQFSDLSPLQKEMIEKFKLPENAAIKKLIPNLKNKKKYVVYGTTLKLYLQLGLVLTKIHRVMAFEQKPWLAPYIKHNTEERKKATSDFQKNLWKLKNNAVYGKTCEQTRKRRNLNFTKQGEKFRKLVKSPLYHSFDIFDYGLVAVERRKAKIHLDRPLYTGQVVLDISKEIMYDFHFNCMKKKYGDAIHVCGSDTDSLIYKIKTDDVYNDMLEMKEWFDTSDYPVNHPLYSVVNKKVLGKFKDEMNGSPIRAFVGLRPKMYSFQRADEVVKCVGKGVPRSALSLLKFSDYANCLENICSKRVDFRKIGTDRKHHIFTTFSVKKGLSCYDDKRYILSDNVNTLAYGHYSLGGEEENEYDEGAENLKELVNLMETVDEYDEGAENLKELIDAMDTL